jgi:hypothetical protein
MVQGLLGGVGPGLTTGYSGAPWRGSGRSRSSSGYHDSGRIAHAVNGKLGIEPYGGPGNLPITRHFQAVQDVTVAVGTAIADRDRVAGGSHPPPAPTEPSVRISRTGLVRSGFTVWRGPVAPGKRSGAAV